MSLFVIVARIFIEHLDAQGYRLIRMVLPWPVSIIGPIFPTYGHDMGSQMIARKPYQYHPGYLGTRFTPHRT